LGQADHALLDRLSPTVGPHRSGRGEIPQSKTVTTHFLRRYIPVGDKTKQLRMLEITYLGRGGRPEGFRVARMNEQSTVDVIHLGERLTLRGAKPVERAIPPPASREPIRQPAGREPRRRGRGAA
jgi:hypothetical protein